MSESGLEHAFCTAVLTWESSHDICVDRGRQVYRSACYYGTAGGAGHHAILILHPSITPCLLCVECCILESVSLSKSAAYMCFRHHTHHGVVGPAPRDIGNDDLGKRRSGKHKLFLPLLLLLLPSHPRLARRRGRGSRHQARCVGGRPVAAPPVGLATAAATRPRRFWHFAVATLGCRASGSSSSGGKETRLRERRP